MKDAGHSFRIFWILLFSLYGVVIAGSIVRMTGSGMGCPDWPKCFGHYIPPTSMTQLTWSPYTLYKSGQVIIVNEQLKVAKQTFTSTQEYNSINWALYTKHGYAQFNVWHTWVEYINRLLGALAGCVALGALFFSIYSWFMKRIRSKVVWCSFFLVLGIGFQGWIGATVVYSVLEPHKITIHMLMALILIGLNIYTIRQVQMLSDIHIVPRRYKRLILFYFFLSTIQVLMGAQVRQFVDLMVDSFGYEHKMWWLKNPPFIFYTHRSFSILLIIYTAGIAYASKKNPGVEMKYSLIFCAIVLLEVSTGIAMYYFDFPFLTQPVHLVCSFILLGSVLYYYLGLSTYLGKNKIVKEKGKDMFI